MFVQLNLGRNIDSTPMSTAQWLMFQVAAADLLMDADPNLDRDDIEFHYGTGLWDGVAEDSCHVSAPVGDDVHIIERIRIGARNLANAYSQVMVGVLYSA